MIELVNNKNKKLELINKASTVIEKVEKIQADFSQQDKAAVDYIKNKPCYKKVETSLTSEVIANPQLGITLLYDLNQLYKGYYKYYTLPYLTNTNSPYQMGINCRLYMTSDYYVDTFIQASSGKLLDTVNVKLDINTVQGFYAYYITDLKALSEENKAKFPSIGIYFEATNESYLANIKNIQSVVYSYTRLTKYYMPTDTVYTEDMTSYVDEAIAAIEVGGATGGSGNVVCDTLLDITTTEQTKIVGITIDNLDEYFTLYIAGYITPCEDLTAASTAMLIFRGNAISRELPVGYPNMTPKDFGKFAYVFNINNGIMTGTGHLRKANWTNDTTGCPIDLPYPNEKNLIKIQALNAPYLPIGTQLVIKGLRKSEV